MLYVLPVLHLELLDHDHQALIMRRTPLEPGKQFLFLVRNVQGKRFFEEFEQRSGKARCIIGCGIVGEGRQAMTPIDD